jgi:hypothetical protein
MATRLSYPSPLYGHVNHVLEVITPVRLSTLLLFGRRGVDSITLGNLRPHVFQSMLRRPLEDLERARELALRMMRCVGCDWTCKLTRRSLTHTPAITSSDAAGTLAIALH